MIDLLTSVLDTYVLAAWLPTLGAALALAVAGRYTARRVCYIGANEQLLLKQLTKKIVINGPAVHFPSVFTVLSFKKRKAISLSEMQYLLVKDESTGVSTVVRGPLSVFLGAYDTAGPPQTVLTLSSSEYLHVRNSHDGTRSIVRGPCIYVPGPHEEIIRKASALALNNISYALVEDTLSGAVRVERGEKVLWLEPHERILGTVRSAFSLKAHQQVRLRDRLTGIVRVERGPAVVFPTAHEDALDSKDGGVMDAIDLKAWEYTVIQDLTTGKVRVERGEKLVWLGGSERIVGSRNKKAAVLVDKQHAVLVRNRDTGVQTLVQEPQLFVPATDEEVVEVRERITLAEHEAVVLKDESGDYSIRFGDPAKGTERAFFLPPYVEVVTLCWSRGRRREKRDLFISTFDCRPQYMSFEFNCRTSDNVEMVLEGTFFWEVVDIASMLRYTGDAPGDVCSHARSCFIQLISKVTLAEFMDSFNEIARQAHSADDEFYAKRGIKIHSLEVTRYQCADRSTAQILEQIIMETTNRMNRLSCQESENEVQLARLHGAVACENAKSAVLEIQRQHAIETARADGTAEAERCVAFLKHVRDADDGSDDGSQVIGSPKLAEELWHALRKAEGLKDVASGNAHVYFTPADANLTIENKAV